ncbi:unnamed protein product, partial [Ixodes persulcatus]
RATEVGKAAGKARRVTGKRSKDEPLIRCDGFDRWRYLDETDFDTLPVSVPGMRPDGRREVKREAMEETWMRKFEEMREKVKDDEERHEAVKQKSETQVEQMREKLKKEGERLEALQGKWEVKLKEADKRAERERSECEAQRKKVVEMERGETRLHYNPRGGGEGGNLGNEANPAGKNREVETRGAVIEEKKAKSVIIVGSSNISRCAAGIKSKVGGEERVKVRVHPRKCMSEVMESAKNMVWDNHQGENLVVVHAGLNDILGGRGHNLGRQLDAGVRKLREAAEKVHIVMCTILEVQRQAWGTKRVVVEANKVIKQLAEKLGHDVMEVNREAYQRGTANSFDLGGLHHGTRTGWLIGLQMRGKARAFLEACRVLE